MTRNRPSLRLALPAAAAALLGLLTLALGTGAAQQAGSGLGAPAQAPTPDSSAAYAQAAFDAWIHDDDATLTRLTEASVTQVLLARDPGDDAWSLEPQCEAGLGTLYCTWTSGESQLLLGVANGNASMGDPHAVLEAAFTSADDEVTPWP